MKIGSNDISKIYLGSQEINKIYLGSEVVYEASTPQYIINIDKDSTGDYTQVSDTVITNFSYKLYKDIGTVEALNYATPNSEVQFKVKLNAFDNPYYQTLTRIEGDNGNSIMFWRLAGRYLEYGEVINGSDLALGNSTQQIPDNTADWITIKMTYSPPNSYQHRWYCYYSTDGITFNSAGYLILARKISNNVLNSSMLFFIRSNGENVNGQVDLSECYIKINGQYIWKGMIPQS